MKTLPNNSENPESEVSKYDNQGNEPFKIVEKDKLEGAVKILKNRLPRSSHVYNMAMHSYRYPSITVYSLNGEFSENSIFVLIDLRKDYGQEINVSVPLDFTITESVKQAFIATSIIDWNSRYWFPILDSLVSPMIFEISTRYKKNSTTVNPILYYTMSAQEASNLELKFPPGVEVKALNSEGAKLIAKAWKFSRPGTEEYVQEIVEKGTTAGVYIDGTPVCGIIQLKNGHVGLLYTSNNYRNKGYAQICMQYLMKQLGQIGYVVASPLECHNTASKEFHKKMGMTLTHYVEDVIFEKGDFESK